MFTIIIHDDARKEILNLPTALQGKMINLIEKLKQRGQLRMPDSRALGDNLFELRVIERNNIARAIYVYQKDNHLFLLHAFVKKSQKTPSSSLNIARTRIREMLENV